MNEFEVNNKILLLPKSFQDKILRYISTQKKQQRVEGLELLKSVFTKNYFENNFCLEKIQYNNFGKPFINHQIDFSLSYSNNNVVLGITKNAKIGVDLEQIREIDLLLYKDFFSEKEWDFIKKSDNEIKNFFTLWTRKEAVSKAFVQGMLLDFCKLDVMNDLVFINNTSFIISSSIALPICFPPA